jgi:hypothetical protein
MGFYQHAGVQVLLDAEGMGNVLVKPTVVESQLLRWTRGSLAHHTLARYRDSLEACFEAAELHEYLATEGTDRDEALINTPPKQLPSWLLSHR